MKILSEHEHTDAMTAKNSGTTLTFATATFIIGKILHLKCGFDPFLGEVAAAAILCVSFVLPILALKKSYLERTFQFITVLGLLVASVYMNNVGQQVTIMQLSMPVVETTEEGSVVLSKATPIKYAGIIPWQEELSQMGYRLSLNRPKIDMRFNKTYGYHEIKVRLPKSCGSRIYWCEVIPKH